jgi:catechol 2,3-dioxygenase-like lactoylglutathione lyase family enzyme
MITAFNHVGISVANLERSIGFYRDLLGMQVIQEVPFEGERYESILGLKGAKGRIAILRIGNLELEFFEFERPVGRPAEPNRPVCDAGIAHFAVQVEDLTGLYARLKAAGVVFHCPPIDFGCAIATYLRDPDGNVIEMLQMPASA